MSGGAVVNWAGALQWLQRPLASLWRTRARQTVPGLTAEAGMVIEGEKAGSSGESHAASIS